MATTTVNSPKGASALDNPGIPGVVIGQRARAGASSLSQFQQRATSARRISTRLRRLATFAASAGFELYTRG